GQLPQEYFQGQERRRTLALQNAFPNGLPRDGQGNLDIQQILDTSARLGGAETVGQLLPIAQRQQVLDADNASGGFGGVPPARANPGPNTGPANLRATPRWTGGDNGQNTLMSLVTGVYGPEQAGVVANRYAQAYRRVFGADIDPNEPLSPQQIEQFSRIANGRLTRAGGND